MVRASLGRILALLALVLLAGAALAEDGAAPAAPSLTIVHVNDWDRMDERDGRGGFARFAALVAAERAAGPPVIVTHAGDALSPSLYSVFDQGAHMVALLNRLEIDAFTPGNHEFDFGPEVAAARFAEAAFPVLASNLAAADGSRFPGTVERVLIEAGDVTLGLFGLITETTPMVSDAGDARFLPAPATAARMAGELRAAGADLVVALAHLGSRADIALARDGLVDLVLGGNDHVLLAYYDGATAVVQSGSQAERPVAIDLTVTRATGDDGVETIAWAPQFRFLDSARVAPDPEMAAAMAAIRSAHAAGLDEPVATVETPLDSRRTTVRRREAAIGNLIADALRARFDADIGLMNGGGIRAERRYPAGTVLTRGDVLAELPFNNHAVLLQVSGAVLRAALEVGLGNLDWAGRFPQVSGLTVTFDPARPAGARVLTVTVGDAALDPDAHDTLATNDFLAGGGDGYVMLAGEARRLGDGPLVAQLVIDHLQAAGTVAPAVEGRLVEGAGE